MDSFEIKTGEQELQLINGDATKCLQILFKHDTKGYALLKSAIEREFRPNGSPEVIAMQIDRVKYSTTTHEGSFRVVLDIDYTFGCEDLLIEKKEQTSEWTMLVDPGKALIFFYGSPYIDSRSTANEF